MDEFFLRTACAMFLALLGGARLYYFFEAKLHPHEENAPHVGWGKEAPAYVTSTVWTVYVAAWVIWPDRICGVARDVPAFTWMAWVEGLGVGLMAFSLWLFWYSHRTIGKFWSIQVKLKEDHQLIRHGPYRLIRNPLYTSFFLGLFGTVLASHSWMLAMWAFALVWSYTVFAREEERMLESAFGADYRAYCSEAGMFLPRLRLRR